jgi:hypothetical protein
MILFIFVVHFELCSNFSSIFLSNCYWKMSGQGLSAMGLDRAIPQNSHFLVNIYIGIDSYCVRPPIPSAGTFIV